MSKNQSVSRLMKTLANYTRNNSYAEIRATENYFNGNVPQIFQKPTYEEYGIPSNISEFFSERRRKFDRLETVLKWFFFILGYFLMVYLFIKHLNSDVSLHYMALACLPLYAFAATFMNELFSTKFHCFLGKFEVNTELHKKYDKYLDAVKAYQYWQTVNTLDYWMNLDGHQFEEAVASAFRRKGYSAKVSKQGGDGGIDIILRKGTECIAVQCKAHKSPIGPSVARDLYGTMQHYGYTKGMLVSRSGFTGGTLEFSFGKNIQLISLNQLLTITQER